MKTIEEMKSELSKAGYRGEWVFSGNEQAFLFVFSNSIEVSDWDKDKAIKAAYAYLKQVQFLDEIARLSDDYHKLGTGHSIGKGMLERDILRVVLSWQEDSDE